MTQPVPYPDMALDVAFNANPNSSDNPLHTDLTAMFVGANAVTRGKLYELAQSQGSTPSGTFRDPLELLNPSNPASPWVSGLLPYRGVSWQAMHPRGGTGNLINQKMWRQPIDPSFENYPVGSNPAGFTWFGATGLISTSTPFQGSQCLSQAITGGGGTQGLAVALQLIPGRAYTWQAAVRQSVANTINIQVLGHAGIQTTTTTGAWVVLSGSFTADQPTMSVGVFNSAGTSDTMLIDAVMLEQAVAATPNAAFAQGLAGWTASHAAAVVATDWFRSGSQSCKITPDGISFTSGVRSGDFAAVAGSRWLISGQMFSPTGTGVQACGVSIDWYTSGHAFISTSSTALTPLAAGVQNLYSVVVTAPATAAIAQVYSEIRSGFATNIHYVDELMAVPVSPSAFTTSGSVIYPVLRQFVEQWPRSWQSNGFEGYCLAQFVDGFTPMNKIELHTEFAEAVLSTAPKYYWRLNEPSNAISLGETSGNGGPPLLPTNGAFGPAETFGLGASMLIPGDPNGTGMSTNTTDVGFLNLPATIAQTGGPNTTQISLGAFATDFAITRAVVMSYSGLLASSNGRIFMYLPVVSDTQRHQGRWQWSSPNLAFGDGETTLSAPGTTWGDGNPHLFVHTTSVVSGSVTSTLYVDGAQIATTTAAWTYGLAPAANGAQIGGAINWAANTTVTPGLENGKYAHFALWDRALAPAEIADLGQALAGYPGETFATRISRHISRGGLKTGTNNIPSPRLSTTGRSTLSPANTPEKTPLLQDIQNAVLAEIGTVWIAPDGATVAESRDDRFKRLTPSQVFGEDSANGECPYTSGIMFSLDPLYVYGDVQVQRTGGGVFTGGAAADVAATNSRYFGGAYLAPNTLDLNSDQQTQDYADWTFYTHDTPVVRIRSIQVNPMGNPALWPVVLGLEVGKRVTVKRRPTGLNGSGLAMSADYFVEQISHDNINFDDSVGPLSWLTTLYLSPAGATNQPWILGDPTWGVLGSTTIPGF